MTPAGWPVGAVTLIRIALRVATEATLAAMTIPGASAPASAVRWENSHSLCASADAPSRAAAVTASRTRRRRTRGTLTPRRPTVVSLRQRAVARDCTGAHVLAEADP